jgi:hypothetical protein
MEDTANNMNTRSDIEALLELDVNGVIITPGKFEGSPAYVPYYWDKGLDGWADDEPDEVSYLFYITKEDINEFPELSCKDRVVVTIDDYGFVYETTIL